MLLAASACASKVGLEKGAYRYYRVKKGDTLSAISKRFGVSVRLIARINGLRNPNVIRVGQVLKIPARPTRRPSFSWPVRGRIVRGFGLKDGIRNTGIDIYVKPGTPVRASASGRVVFSGEVGEYGEVVIIDHGGGYKTVYGYLSRVSVKKGMYVRKGRVIGYSGYDVSSTLPVLHFEVRLWGKPRNPVIFLD